MTTVEALQLYYVSRGGNFSDVENISTIPAMIVAINEIADPEQSTPITEDDVDEIVSSIS